MNSQLLAQLEEALGASLVGSSGVGGGSINVASRVELSDGRSVFIKTHDTAPPDMFPEEARGLRALAATKGPPTPAVLYVDSSALVLEWLAPGRLDREGWASFGRSLASLHRHTESRHGFEADNYIGATPQPNPWTEDGISFFGAHRLGFQVELAARRGLLSASALRRGEALISRLPELLPATEPASFIHGDLWTGNAFARADGVGCLVDPAAHYGFREAELAMTRLFGSLPEAFYGGYEEAWPLAAGAAQRVALFNLYHLLNHLNLFGRGYLGQVEAVLQRFG